MADSAPEAAPILSTPDTRLLEATAPVTSPHDSCPARSDEELAIIYDIERTLREIRQGRWKRIALQFPDDMLPDAPRVFQLLSRGLQQKDIKDVSTHTNGLSSRHDAKDTSESQTDLVESVSQLNVTDSTAQQGQPPRLYILADTSYGTCCVDEVAAEHVNADVVVHYGRACLSPTARLPVIYVFTRKPLPLEFLVKAFRETYPDLSSKIILAADVTYSDHIPAIYDRLVQEGYTNLFATSVVHDPSSAIPNRTVPESVKDNPDVLNEWQLFHVSDPPTALLLTLSSRVAAIHIYPTGQSGPDQEVKPLPASTAAALRRRYAILTSLTTVPIFGILINTLSVKNYLHIVDYVKSQIAAAGKKSYMFVVGKLNAAKVANFSEVGGWVVIGCWESSLVDSKDFWKPVITPFELELALQSDMTRIWTGAWRSDYQTILDAAQTRRPDEDGESAPFADDDGAKETGEDELSDFESAPPEFDLRTGRYVSNSRPMQYLARNTQSAGRSPAAAKALAKRAKGDLATIGGTVSPGAEFLRSQRTWKGLGSDFDIRYDEDDTDSTVVVEGRRGVARGYTVGDSADRH
jgi:diphthamide biosynthesis protein 2